MYVISCDTERQRRKKMQKKKTENAKFLKSVRLRMQQGNRALNFPHKIRCVRAQALTCTCVSLLWYSLCMRLGYIPTARWASYPTQSLYFIGFFFLFFLFLRFFCLNLRSSKISLSRSVVSSSVTLRSFFHFFVIVFLSLFSPVVEYTVHCSPFR